MSRPKQIWFRRLRLLLAIILVMAVLYVSIAPALDLAPSALRALMAALVVLSCLRLSLDRVAGSSSIALLRYGIADWRHGQCALDARTSELIDLHCTRLC